MAFKHELGITKGQWLCAEVIRESARKNEIERLYEKRPSTFFRSYIKAIKVLNDRVFQLVVTHNASEDLLNRLLAMACDTHFATETDLQDFWIHSYLKTNEEYATLK
jgi:hypothetical protein